MSYLSFGTIVYKKKYHEKKRDNFAWEIFQAGIGEKLFIALFPMLPQKIVNEMLDEQCDNKNSHFRFLITSSPIRDTSDDLISPAYFGESELTSVFKNIFLISKWIKTIIKYDGVEKINLLLTEGYDNNFKQIKINLDDMFDVIKTEVDRYGDIPSIKIEIEK